MAAGICHITVVRSHPSSTVGQIVGRATTFPGEGIGTAHSILLSWWLTGDVLAEMVAYLWEILKVEEGWF